MNSLPIEIDCRGVQTLQESGETFFFCDCREADEYATASIAGATLIPMSEITARLDDLEPHRDVRVVVHCHHGGRSLRVATWLRNQGFAKAQSMAGGIDQWSQQIDPAIPRY
jgi:rhodanese-related sulfurtransferase